MGACRELPEDDESEFAPPRILDLIIASHVELAIASGTPAKAADKAARKFVQKLLKRIGGLRWKVPRSIYGPKHAKAERDAAVREMWEALRRPEPGKGVRPSAPDITLICRTFDIKRTVFYEIIGRKTKG